MCGLEEKGIGEEVVKSFKENKICGATFLGMSSHLQGGVTHLPHTLIHMQVCIHENVSPVYIGPRTARRTKVPGNLAHVSTEWWLAVTHTNC